MVGAPPAAELAHLRVERQMLGKERRVADRRMEGAAAKPRDRRHVYPGEGRSERGDAEPGCLVPADLGEAAEEIEARCAALVGGHAPRGVALEVLDRAKTLGNGDPYVA